MKDCRWVKAWHGSSVVHVERLVLPMRHQDCYEVSDVKLTLQDVDRGAAR